MGSEYKLLGKDDTYQLIAAAKTGDENAKEQLIRANTGLVKSIALKFVNQGYELDDLMQLGYIGLIKAIERFDESYDVMFSTYAVPMILGEVKRFLRDDGRIKVGRQTKQDIRRMRQLSEEFCREKGRTPKVSELAELMDVNEERILYLFEAAEAVTNMESLDNPDCGAERIATAGNEEEKMVERIYLKAAISRLAERERKVIVLRYFRDMTQQQIAGLLGLSQVQVSRIEKKVMEGLRKEMNRG